MVAWRHDLGAVGPVDLVSVVLGRIVTRGDHHACGRAEVPYGECHQRCGYDIGEPVHPYTRGGEHRSSVVGKRSALASRIVADDDAPFGSIAKLLQETSHQSRRCPDDDGAVHSIGPGAHESPQSGRAELQASGESFHQLSAVATRQDPSQLLARRLVRIGEAPGFGGSLELVLWKGPGHGTRLARFAIDSAKCVSYEPRRNGTASRILRRNGRFVCAGPFGPTSSKI